MFHTITLSVAVLVMGLAILLNGLMLIGSILKPKSLAQCVKIITLMINISTLVALLFKMPIGA
ncbi:hypothetical protein [Vibrio phage JSF23]|jgi:hypothetical protein|uniref:Uncharacterized protein n=4 Tax=Icepovirus bengalense TaxID=2846603 RepID=A0A2D0Z7M5_9CAUD|nr:hypothetical protein ViPhICP2p32 [Vibrio phage ICP2]ADX87714.1 hypothetical protein [Vibrio phage ICP2]ADX87784.1 hypothetical protein TU12-16_00150 [Vibrio phage ICP2_2006_A]ASV43729.1 hypothetical protein [Vibrio phage JSF23]ASV43825.1 hypothetical protein [Vibrio phage JSF27]